MKTKAPIFIDPIFNGAADPMIIKNEQDGTFFMFYTQRRATVAFEGSVSYCYGSKIGVAQSTDNGREWFYRGALDLDFEFGDNTFWAPEIVWDKSSNKYHMFVTYIRGIHDTWSGDASIQHYISDDLLYWDRIGKVEIDSTRVIDPCLYQLDDGTWRMWYKDERDGAHTYYADSSNLYDWKEAGQATFDFAQEGPNVFKFGDKYWLVACEWSGQGVYSSTDLTAFTRQDGARLLSDVSSRKMDGAVGRHVDVYTCDDRAFIVYFVHYNDSMDKEADTTVSHAPTVVQIAEFHIKDGKLVCDRNEDFEINLT